MRGVFLDIGSVDRQDLELTQLQQCLEHWQIFDATAPHQVAQRVHDAEVVVTNKTVIDKQLLQTNSSIKLICVAATGTNNVDLSAAAENNVVVCNVRNYATSSVVQHVFALMLALQNHILAYRDALQQGAWNSATHFCLLDNSIHELAGQTIGILGYGTLGKAVARMAQAFSMNVLLWARVPDAADKRRKSLRELLVQSDVVSIHTPLTEQTRHLISTEQLRLMKPTALLINTARGGIVDEQALLDALLQRRIGGAGIDVLSEEPPVHGNILINAHLPNLIVTPHVAWASRQSRQRLIDELVLNIEAYRRGEHRNQVL